MTCIYVSCTYVLKEALNDNESNSEIWKLFGWKLKKRVIQVTRHIVICGLVEFEFLIQIFRNG